MLDTERVEKSIEKLVENEKIFTNFVHSCNQLRQKRLSDIIYERSKEGGRIEL